MRSYLISLSLIGLVLAGFFYVAPPIADGRFNPVSENVAFKPALYAQQVHNRLFIADMHSDFLLWQRDLLQRHERGHVDLPRLQEGNVALQVFSVVTKSPWGQNYLENESTSDRITLLAVAQRWPVESWISLMDRALYQAHRLYKAKSASRGKLYVIQNRLDLDRFLERRATDRELVAGVLALEGLHALEGDLENVDVLFAAGYRMMAPVHLFDNDLGGSAAGVDKGGLTDFGRQVIRRMEQKNIIIDLAHASPELIDDVLLMTRRPLVVSHTGVQGTCPGPRNLSDDHIRGVAASGGVIGIGFWEGAVCDGSVDGIVAAMKYVKRLVGVQYIALGSDFDGSVRTPFDASELNHLTDALLAAGFTEGEVAKIMGDNFLRVLRSALP